MRTIFTALLLGASLTACGTGAGIAGTAAAGGAAGVLEVEIGAPSDAEVEATVPAAEQAELVGDRIAVPTPPADLDPGIVGHADNNVEFSPLALDGNVQTQVWGLYFDFQAKYGEVIADMQADLGTQDQNDSTEAIIAGACATKASDGAVDAAHADLLTTWVGPILERRQLDVPTLLADIADYHRQVIDLGVCG